MTYFFSEGQREPLVRQSNNLIHPTRTFYQLGTIVHSQCNGVQKKPEKVSFPRLGLLKIIEARWRSVRKHQDVRCRRRRFQNTSSSVRTCGRLLGQF